MLRGQVRVKDIGNSLQDGTPKPIGPFQPQENPSSQTPLYNPGKTQSCPNLDVYTSYCGFLANFTRAAFALYQTLGLSIKSDIGCDAVFGRPDHGMSVRITMKVTTVIITIRVMASRNGNDNENRTKGWLWGFGLDVQGFGFRAWAV